MQKSKKDNEQPSELSKSQNIESFPVDYSLWRQSASTWLHSTQIVGFPKAKRFPETSLRSDCEHFMPPSSLSKRSTSLGFWKKTMMPEGKLKYASQIPAPNTYKLRGDFEENLRYKKGKTMGLSYAYFRKTYYPNMKYSPEPEMFALNPAPNMYQSIDKFAEDKMKFSMYEKGKDLTEVFRADVPASNSYSPSFKFVEPNRFHKINFGFGNKMDLSKALNQNPGVGSYNLPSVFDKKKKLINNK